MLKKSNLGCLERYFGIARTVQTKDLVLDIIEISNIFEYLKTTIAS